jgi:phosphatidylglycerophosphatase A
MKQEIERRKPQGFVDYLSLAITTVGVGYLPLAPGTYGSAVGVAIYVFIGAFEMHAASHNAVNGQVPGLVTAFHWAMNAILFTVFCLIGIWASGRSTSMFGNSDPSQAVIDEVMGQIIVFFFVPFGITWPFILAGFLLFRLFDIWKPYPIDALQILPGGLGICFDDLVAGVYGGICLAVGYAIYLSI